jgi:hypothetical protein
MSNFNDYESLLREHRQRAWIEFRQSVIPKDLQRRASRVEWAALLVGLLYAGPWVYFGCRSIVESGRTFFPTQTEPAVGWPFTASTALACVFFLIHLFCYQAKIFGWGFISRARDLIKREEEPFLKRR